jgi:hypothetical protein
MKARLGNLSLIVVSFLVSLFAAELVLRTLFPFYTFGLGQELQWFRTAPPTNRDLITPDTQLGFRPVVDNGLYDEYGILSSGSIFTNEAYYTKILFLGDSVTARARLLRALYVASRNNSFAFLNGGVEGYNIQQEVDFFFRYQQSVQPHRIVHTIHVNDLQSTPIAFRDEDGKLHVYALNTSRQIISPTLYKFSHLYRLAVASTFPRRGLQELATDARLSLARMVQYAKENSTPYYIVIFPILSAYRNWSEHEKTSHMLLLQMCKELEIDLVDLLPVLDEMLSEGLDPKESIEDNWHPNDLFARRAAKRMLDLLPTTLQSTRKWQ